MKQSFIIHGFRFANLLTAIAALLISGFATGCGGGGGNHRSPLFSLTPGQGVTLRGAVTGPAGARSASAAPVAGAEVAYYTNNNPNPLSTTTTDAEGRYQLPVLGDVKGRLVVIKSGAQLQALVITSGMTSGVVERNVSIESTVVALAATQPDLNAYDPLALEELVRLGEAPEVLAAVTQAFSSGRPVTVTAEVLAATAQRLKTSEQGAVSECESGAQWCIGMTAFQPATAGQYESKILLRKNRTGAHTAGGGGSVGAGQIWLRLPSGLTATGIAGNNTVEEGTQISQGVNGDGQTVVAFLHDTDTGATEAQVLGVLTVSASTTPAAGSRPVLENHRLTGLLNEKRSGARQSAKAALP